MLGIAESALTVGGAVVIHKNGAAGAVVTTSSGSTQIDAPIVREVDPDGAGDIFAAGYVAATLLGHPPGVAARVGCVVAPNPYRFVGPLESEVGHVSKYIGR